MLFPASKISKMSALATQLVIFTAFTNVILRALLSPHKYFR